MMRRLLLIAVITILQSCSPIKNPISNEYQLSQFSAARLSQHAEKHSILVSLPEAAAGYDSTDMIYVEKPFELRAYANNAWISAPNNMLLPLITQSLQQSGLFFAVASNVTGTQTDYRLDSQLIELKQNFLRKPSTLDLSLKITLIRQHDDEIVASAVFRESVPCESDSPYGGVLAANKATLNLTAKVTNFVNGVIR